MMSRNPIVTAIAGAAIALIGIVSAHAGAGPVEPRLNSQKVLATSEAALGRTIGAYTLFDSDGKSFSLTEYRGRPLVISLIYTSCSSVCPTTTQHLLDAVDQARKVLGADRFEMLSVGFDARNDTPKRLNAFAEAQGINRANWRLASGNEEALSALLKDLGFSYVAAAGAFEHITQTTIVDAEGRVYRHVYGDEFPIQVFFEPLKEVVYGLAPTSVSVSSLIDRVKFLCTTYDPNLGRYRISYALPMGIGIGALSLIITGFIIGGAWRRSRPLDRA